MPYYRQVGAVPPKRHTQLRSADGTLRLEELMGAEGFSSDSSLLYHRRVPSAIVDARMWDLGDQSTTANAPLLPRHLRLHDLFTANEHKATDVVTGRRPVLGNADVRISYVVAGQDSPLYRNAIGDECVYIESGSGTVETMFGPLPVRAHDYVVLPRGTVHRWVPAPADPLRAYVIEAAGHVVPPKPYLSERGQFLERAPYCERDLHGPQALPETETEDDDIGVEVYVKHRGSGPGGIGGTVHVQRGHPFDLVGWDGTLYPFTFNLDDFDPFTGRVHQPPPVHQVWAGPNFVVCNFVPRKVDYHPQSIPAPYYHSNVDSDEVMFYCGGEYGARKGSGIGLGSISLHPSGFVHGPQPGSYERSIGVEAVDEIAVMIDTFRPLELGAAAGDCEDPSYAWSWARK